jgi:hypothetical protein
MQAMAQDIPTPPPAELKKADEAYNPSDLGSMGWKLGKKLVRKVRVLHVFSLSSTTVAFLLLDLYGSFRGLKMPIIFHFI